MTKRQQTKLVEEFMALNLREEVGFERAMAIVDALESVPLPRASDIKKWRKNLAKLDAKMHRELDKKPGTYHYWEKERRGKFIIGGDTKKPRGLLLGMHGGGVGSGDASSSAGAYSNAAKELDLIAIFPEVLEKTEHGWTDSGTEEWVMDLVDAAIRTWEIDPNLVYFSGHSMGGYGSWTLGAHHADRVAALAPSAGAPTPVYDKPGGVIVEVDSGVVPNLRNIAMVVFQSIDDPRVPPDVNQAAVQEVERAKLKWGGYDKFTYWEVNGRGHGYPEGGMLALLERIVDFERDPLPQKIVWQPRLDWKHQYHWLYWQRPIENAIVVSEYHRDSNTIEISSEQELKHMWVLLDDRLVDMKNEVTIKVNGEITNQALPQGSLGALLLTTSGPDTALSFPARLPIRGTLE
ncbi:MAG: alpha/beta hydrolase [Planctomycetota bacterium]|nr:alpha/beta hydrolase [Planctomycetota bacterium]